MPLFYTTLKIIIMTERTSRAPGSGGGSRKPHVYTIAVKKITPCNNDNCFFLFSEGTWHNVKFTEAQRAELSWHSNCTIDIQIEQKIILFVTISVFARSASRPCQVSRPLCARRGLRWCRKRATALSTRA